MSFDPMSAFTSAFNSFLSPVASRAGNELSTAIFGREGRIRREDFDHHQNLADIGNPREIARQGEFLTGITPFQAQAHNQYQDETYHADTARANQRITDMTPVQAAADKQYMDTVYAGTSAWERLGSNASPSLSAPNPQGFKGGEAPGAGNFLQSLIPLQIAKMNNETSLQQASMNNATSERIAQLQTSTQTQNVNTQTANGQLPLSQAAAAAAQALLTTAQQTKTEADTHAVYQTMKVQVVDLIQKLSPTEVYDLGFAKYDTKPWAKAILPILTAGISPGDRRNAIDDAIQRLPAGQLNVMTKDILEMIGLASKGAQGINSAVRDTRGFLHGIGNMFRKNK